MEDLTKATAVHSAPLALRHGGQYIVLEGRPCTIDSISDEDNPVTVVGTDLFTKAKHQATFDGRKYVVDTYVEVPEVKLTDYTVMSISLEEVVYLSATYPHRIRDRIDIPLPKGDMGKAIKTAKWDPQHKRVTVVVASAMGEEGIISYKVREMQSVESILRGDPVN